MPLSDKATSKLPMIRQPMDLPSTDGMTLEKVLQNQTVSPFSLHDFADYLEQTYCSENLAFYMAVTDYQRSARLYFGSTPETLDTPVIISGQPFRFCDSEQGMLNHEEHIRFDTLKAKYNDIIERFILTNAPQEVNIPYELRQQLLQTYHEHQSYHPVQLKPACVAVVELLRISAFIPFVTDPSRLIVPTSSKSTTSSKSVNSGSKSTSTLSPRRLRSSPSLAVNDSSPPPPVPALPLTLGIPMPSTCSRSESLSPTSNNTTWLDFDNMSIASTTSTSLASPSTFLKKLTTSLRFRARSQSPPRQNSWRQINISDPQAFVATHSHLSNSSNISSSIPVMERAFSNSSVTSNSTVSSRGSITTPTINPPSSTTKYQQSTPTVNTHGNHSSRQQPEQQQQSPPGTLQPFIY